MRPIKHYLIFLILLVGVFFSVGWIDRARLGKATMTHKPDLLFAHQKLIIQDGGSVIWLSFVYEANESRRMEVVQDEVMHIVDGFQGVNWTWRYLNLLWIVLLVFGLFLWNRMRNSKRS